MWKSPGLISKVREPSNCLDLNHNICGEKVRWVWKVEAGSKSDGDFGRIMCGVSGTATETDVAHKHRSRDHVQGVRPLAKVTTLFATHEESVLQEGATAPSIQWSRNRSTSAKFNSTTKAWITGFNPLWFRGAFSTLGTAWSANAFFGHAHRAKHNVRDTAWVNRMIKCDNA